MEKNAILLDGKALSVRIEEELKLRVNRIIDITGKVPVLATILVGNDPSSEVYVRMKGNACERVGMTSRKIHLPENIRTEELLSVIDGLNSDDDICGILLQHPVPGQINERECFDRIAIEKDVDGVTCLGFGRMSMNERAYGSATPSGIMELLRYHKIQISGKHAVVVGRSPILGKPVAMMLLNENATVTVCHSRTAGLAGFIGNADIVIGALGKPEFIKADWIKKGAVVIDAGYHKGGIGDIESSGLENKALAYTPVPGGVGPMTIAMLMKQTVDSAERRLQE